MRKSLFRKGLVLGIILLFVGMSIIPSINGTMNDLTENDTCLRNQLVEAISYNDNLVDINYIKEITKYLSYIIFTEYNESAGEIAKGRAFGSKGERAAAEYLAGKMEELGLYDPTNNSKKPYHEQIKIITDIWKNT